MADCKTCGVEKNWSILIKPTHNCNFNCQYCYDEPFRRKYRGTTMTMEVLNDILKKAAKHTDKLQLIWHGGEPLIVGKQWYRDAQDVIAMYPELTVEQSMQSNGSLLDAEWAALVDEYDIEVGVSYDGPYQSVRDNRAEEVEAAIKEFKKAGGNPGFICVINHQNYKNMIESYEYFKNEMQSGVSFNRIFDTEEAIKNGLKIDVDDYMEEYMKFYEYWIFDNNGVSERTSVVLTEHLFGLGTNLCTYSDCRYKWFGFNPVGDIYPCDRFVPDKYVSGNILDFESIYEAYMSDGYQLYNDENNIRMEECAKCDYAPYCGGGCIANHITYAGDATKNDPMICETFKKTFKEAYKLWRDIDITDKSLNDDVSKMIIESKIILPMEIKTILKELDPTIELNYIDDIDGLMGCTEFKVFRLLNPLQKSSFQDHTDFSKPDMSISVDRSMSNLFSYIKDARNEYAREFIRVELQNIRDIVSGGGDIG